MGAASLAHNPSEPRTPNAEPRIHGCSGFGAGQDLVLTEEVVQAVYQPHVAELVDGDPCCFLGVVTCTGWRRVEDVECEVEDHVVVGVGVGADSLDPADEAGDDACETGLLGALPDDGFAEVFAELNSAPGDGPGAGGGAGAGAPEEDAAVVDRDRADGDLGYARHPAGRCMTMMRAVKPDSSKKFFAARAPGSANASTPMQPARDANATSSVIIASPTPTDRAPSSTKRSVITARRAPSWSTSISKAANPMTTSSIVPTTTQASSRSRSAAYASSSGSARASRSAQIAPPRTARNSARIARASSARRATSS